MLRVSVDIGGTFTDMVVAAADGSVEMFKSPSTHDQLSRGVMNCLGKAAEHYRTSLDGLLAEVDTIIHGTTVTTNALLTRAGAATGMITTEGFRDIIEMRRGMRVGYTPYNLKVAFPEPLIPRFRRLTVRERVRFDGASRTVVDGPFAETRELIAGFWLLQCDSLQECIDWIKRCPSPFDGPSEIEIRQVFEAEDFGAEFTEELREQEERLRARIAGKD